MLSTCEVLSFVHPQCAREWGRKEGRRKKEGRKEGGGFDHPRARDV